CRDSARRRHPRRNVSGAGLLAGRVVRLASVARWGAGASGWRGPAGGGPRARRVRPPPPPATIIVAPKTHIRCSALPPPPPPPFGRPLRPHPAPRRPARLW